MALEIWLIATRLNLRPRQVTHWFQNKRGRDRRVQKITAAFSRMCVHCGASFICDEFLDNHVKTHKTKSHVPCTDCKVVFLSPILLETHALYHTSVPNDKIPRKAPDGVKDPMIEGQVRNAIKSEPAEKAVLEDRVSSSIKSEPVEDPVSEDHVNNGIKSEPSEYDSDHSDSSEGELKIDESEDYSMTNENNDDEQSDSEQNGDPEQEALLSDRECEPCSEEEKMESNVSTASDLDEEGDCEVIGNEHEQPQSPPHLHPVEEDGSEDTSHGDSAKNHVRQEVFFDDNTDSSDDDEDEPRLRIVSAYAVTANPDDMEVEEEL